MTVLHKLELGSAVKQLWLKRSAIANVSGELGVSSRFQCCTSLRLC